MNRKNNIDRFKKFTVHGTTSGQTIMESNQVLAPTLGRGEDAAGVVVIKRKAAYRRPAIFS